MAIVATNSVLSSSLRIFHQKKKKKKNQTEARLTVDVDWSTIKLPYADFPHNDNDALYLKCERDTVWKQSYKITQSIN